MVLDESSEHEPDPPEEPSVGDFSPGEPDAPYSDLADADVPKQLQTTFWLLVGVFNGAILALGLGAMFIVFESRFTLGGSLFFAGLGLSLYGWRTYRRARKG